MHITENILLLYELHLPIMSLENMKWAEGMYLSPLNYGVGFTYIDYLEKDKKDGL